jgi:hypothetical protein
MKISFFCSALATTAILSIPACAQAISIFGNKVPQIPDVTDDTAAVTLGVKFYSTQAGTIAGIRFYRGHQASSSGYTVKLFTAGGQLLASAQTGKDTCAVPCWEQVYFASPVSISANTTYVASYYTANGNYADDTGSMGLASAVINGPLVAPASSTVGGNGVYTYSTYSTGFPNQTWQQSNYYVDISFTPAAPNLMISINPTNPVISAEVAPGTVVATVNVTWSDGSPFTGSLGFGSPYSNDGGIFALSGNQIIVNPSGPGVSRDGGTTQNITIVATQ